MKPHCGRTTSIGEKLALVFGCVLVLLSAPAHAIFGFGIHAGKDLVSISGSDGYGTQDFQAAAQRAGITNFNSTFWNPITLRRHEVSNPWLLGGHFYIDAIPFIDLEASVDVALQKYRVEYVSTLSSAANETKDAYFGRASAYFTARRDIIKLPPLVPIAALYLGGGLGYHYVSPVAGPDLIVNAYGSGDPSSKKPDIASLVEREGSFGYHGLVGVRVKPPIVPLAFRVEGKYTVTRLETYERPGGIFSVYVGTSLDF